MRKWYRIGTVRILISLTMSSAGSPKAMNQSNTKTIILSSLKTKNLPERAVDAWVGTAQPEQVVAAFAQLFLLSPERAQHIPCLPPLEDWADNRVSSGFGLRLHPTLHTLRHHDGIDIAGPHQNVRSGASGRVIAVGYNKSLGRYVKVDHANSYETIYGHLALVLVKAGQMVAIGETLGITGSTGRTTGVHLHYSVLKHQQPVNPADYLTLAIRFVKRYQQQIRQTQTR